MVTRETDTRMQQLAKDTGGTVSRSRAVTVDGARSHSYDLTIGKNVMQYTFVLRGKREYQLLCDSNDDANCATLLSSFAA